MEEKQTSGETTETKNETQNEILEVGASENPDTSKKAEVVNESEFTDAANGEETTKKADEKQKQDNSENARRRRERERQAELKKTRYDAIKEAVDGVNPFTNQPIVDDVDIEEYLAMKEIKKQGGDPLADFSKYQKEKQKKEAEVQAQKLKDEEWLENDYKDFKEKHPDVDLQNLALDKPFMSFAENLAGKKPMAEIYDAYQNLVEEIRKKENDALARRVANAKATPGSLTGVTADESSSFFTVEQVKKMSQEEVHKNYDKIMASMKKWK